jgi:serine/threonine-protein kinase
MAPEQAGGGTTPIGPAADVYSLGAILYALLTGRPPFQAATVLETLEQVRSIEPMAPTRLRANLPRDLVTICLKCLEKEPGRRYGSAAELSEDLRRFAAGETIRARPVGIHERLWRWCRREPALALLALALLGGLIGVATQWWRAESHLKEALNQRHRAEENARHEIEANQALRSANDREQTARRQAQERFVAAMKALQGFETLTKDAGLLREPHLQGLRAQLLQTALEFYRELQTSLEEDASPEARTKLADAYDRVADNSWELGLQDEALATHRRALALVEQMAATAPADPNVRASLARRHTRIGFTLRTMGRPDEALRSYEQARAILDQLARENPANAHDQEVLSWTLSNLGVIELELGRPADAIPLQRQALAIHQALVDRYPDNVHYRNDLGWCWRYLTQALAAAGDRDAALWLGEQAVTLYEELVRADGGVIEFRWRLARCLDEVGRIRTQSDRLPEAAEPLERAAGLHEALARDNPVFYGVDLVRNRLYAAFHRAMMGRPEEARACLRRAEEMLKRTPQVRPGTLLHDLACSHILWSAAGREGAIAPPEREVRTQRAIAALRRSVVAGSSDLGQIRRDVVLDPLRSRRDFQEMIMDLSFPADPFPVPQ